MALGATHGRLARRIVSQGLVVMVPGVIMGIGIARLLRPYVAERLYRVDPGDPLTFAAVPALVVIVGLAAVVHAALTAVRTEPARHLQSE